MAIGLAADGSRLWAGPPRCAASLSLQLPGNAPQGRVSSASAHTGPTRRTAALDGFQKSPSLRRGRRAGPLAPGRRAPSYDAPHGSRLLGVGSTVAHLPGLALPWATGSLRAGKIWIPLHGIILPACGGAANRSEVALAEGLKEKAGTPVASRPQELSRRARSDSPAPFSRAPRTPASPSLSRAA